jgi:GTPase SAR1 family protein
LILTELKSKDGHNFVAVIRVFTKQPRRSQRYSINSIVSLFPKDNYEGLEVIVNAAVWMNKQKMLCFIQNHGANLHAVGINPKHITNIVENFDKNKLSGLENDPKETIQEPESIVVNRFEVDLNPVESKPNQEPLTTTVKEEKKEPIKSELFTPITKTESLNGISKGKINLPGDLGKFLGYVERYEYSILLRGEKGAGKTRLTYQLMNTFAKGGFSVNCFSLEIVKQSMNELNI